MSSPPRARRYRGALTGVLAALPLGALAATAPLGCSGSAGPSPAATDGGAAEAGDGGLMIVCGPTGVSKGPWSLAASETSIKLRWEACRPGTAAGLTFTPEAGGAAVHAPSVETPTVVSMTVTAPLTQNIPPDVAGTYYMHEADLGSLAPGTCYRYALDAGSALTGRFCTARKPGAALKFLAIGDTNPGLNETGPLLAHVLPENPDFILHGGDIQYYDSLVETWASWFPVMEPMLAQGAFFPAVGNHESETPDEFTDYYLRFFHGAGFDGTDTYYRFQSGGVWFFSLDTELPTGPGSPQATWFEKELADASKQPGYRFSVTYFHRPFVTCGDTGDNPVAQHQFEPLFHRYGVPLVIQAHMHGYERFEIGGITYLTTAGGGGSIGNVDLNIQRPECLERVASGAYHHATLISIEGGTLKGKVIDTTGAVRDTFQQTVP